MVREIFDLLNSKEFYKLQEYYEKPTIFDILGVSRKELPHSNFIAWLLSPKASHGLNDFAIRKLLEIRYNDLPSDIKSYVLTGDYQISEANVSREVLIESTVSKANVSEKPIKIGILDIFIELKLVLNEKEKKKFYIIIENKIESYENQDQTARYQQWFENAYENADALMLYLSANVKNDLSGNKFVNITYTELSNQLLSYCEIKSTNDNTKRLIQDYICCLSQPLLEGEDDKKHEILAINDIEITLVNELLLKHRDTLLYIIDKLVTRKNTYVNQIYKSRISTFKGIFNVMLKLDSLNEYTDKINSLLENKVRKFQYNGKVYIRGGRDHNSFGQLARDMINAYTIEVSPTCEELKELLASKEGFCPWSDEIISESPGYLEGFFMSEDDAILIDNHKLYVARYWTEDNILVLADLLNQNIEAS